MIYIIDEKTNRQSSYGWGVEKFEKYNDVIKPINDYDVFSDDVFVNALFSCGNVVLLHESFFNGIDPDKKKLETNFQNKLDSFVSDGRITVAYYGGSKRSRKIDGHKVYLPVSVLYEHLEDYVMNCKSGQNNIEYLVWGDNPKIEKQLSEAIRVANETMRKEREDYSDIISNVLLLTSADSKNLLKLPGLKSDIEKLFPNLEAEDPESDELLHSDIIRWLNGKAYDAIILPLCFGPVLSDYNGLRLATHIRCSATPNQCTPIYIYGAVDISYLIGNEYFDILKTNGVYLIRYDNNSIVNAIRCNHSPIEKELLIAEMKKVHLNIPENYVDSHSVANEWAIFGWAKTIRASDADINEVVKNVETNLYFKYLNTIYPISPLNQLKKDDLIIPTNGNKKPKVLLVDDEAEKGWYEIFCTIINDENGFYFDRLDDEFNEKNPDEIVQIVHDKVVSDDIDIVVLDYRLHKSDFFAEHIKDVTGYKVLKDIKYNINRGIQVIVLSATNKIWNWNALKEVGADAFIMKDNPENHITDISTKNIIIQFVKQIGGCCRRAFLKGVYQKIDRIKECIRVSDCFRYKTESGEKDKKEEVFGHLDVAFDLLSKSALSIEYKAYAYLQLFLIIEEYANLPSVFEDTGEDLYLLNGMDKYHILKDKQPAKSGQYRWRSVMTFSSSYKCYIIGEDNYEKRYIETNFRMSALLIFKFGESKSNTYNWDKINYVRNNKAAHPKTKNVKDKEIDQILDFMLFFFDKNNVNWRPLKDAFFGNQEINS